MNESWLSQACIRQYTQRVAFKGPTMWDTRPTQGTLLGHEGVDGAQHASRHKRSAPEPDAQTIPPQEHRATQGQKTISPRLAPGLGQHPACKNHHDNWHACELICFHGTGHDHGVAQQAAAGLIVPFIPVSSMHSRPSDLETANCQVPSAGAHSTSHNLGVLLVFDALSTAEGLMQGQSTGCDTTWPYVQVPSLRSHA